METTYTTKQGDTWDLIAFRVYGDVKYTGWLMKNNYPHLDVFVFSPGTIIQTPELPEEMAMADAPIWRS